MCYEQNRKRVIYNKIKSGQPGQPLIKDKKTMQDISKEKENQRYSHNEYQSKHKNNQYIGNEFTTTTEFESTKNIVIHQGFSQNIHHPLAPVAHHNLDKYTSHQPIPNQPLPNHLHHQHKILKFGDVKSGNNIKIKQPLIHQEISVPVQHLPSENNGNIPKKPYYIAKNGNNNSRIQKSQRSLNDKVGEKNNLERGNGAQKVIHVEKKQKFKVIPAKANLIMPIEDFTCGEQLEFKPVQKKSLIPQKKYIAEKTTSKFDFVKSKKKNDEKKELKDFQLLEKTINQNSLAEDLVVLDLAQSQYLVKSNYLQKSQKNMIWWTRAVLVDWMRHVCFQFSLQRDTYHIAVVLLDNYLAKTPNIQKSTSQAIGATTMFIASKLEEFQCRQSEEFVKATNNLCTVSQIHDLQIKIVKTLNFKLNPPTICSLANKIMSQWDSFLENDEYAKFHPVFALNNKLFFKSFEQKSYERFRKLMQLIDCSILDIQTVQYKAKMLVCSFMYLLIGIQFEQFTSKQVISEFPRSSLYLYDQNSQYNDLFKAFVEYCFGFLLYDLLPTIQYAATYFDLQMTYEKPMIKDMEEQLKSMTLEEYCSYQTYNSSMLKTTKNRFRGIY